MPKPKNLAKEIERHAALIRNAGEYIGLFEWVVWSAMRKACVHMLFGSNIVDVGAMFGPPVCADGGFGPVHMVAAVMTSKSGFWRSAGGIGTLLPTINHYVIAASMPGVENEVITIPPAASSQETAEGGVGVDEKQNYQGSCARKHALNVGWVQWMRTVVIVSKTVSGGSTATQNIHS